MKLKIIFSHTALMFLPLTTFNKHVIWYLINILAEKLLFLELKWSLMPSFVDQSQASQFTKGPKHEKSAYVAYSKTTGLPLTTDPYHIWETKGWMVCISVDNKQACCS